MAKLHPSILEMQSSPETEKGDIALIGLYVFQQELAGPDTKVNTD